MLGHAFLGIFPWIQETSTMLLHAFLHTKNQVLTLLISCSGGGKYYRWRQRVPPQYKILRK
jgi:hypothetical protein